MPSTAVAQKTLCGAQPPEFIFSPEFYAPYCAAAQSALSMLCATRTELTNTWGEDAVRRITFRLKSPESIVGKLRSRRLPVTAEAACTALHDVAGLRVVLLSEEAVYRYALLLLRSPQAELIRLRDYIASPKKSGYRSLHLLMMVPVLSGGESIRMPVEIQLRTTAMDTWAAIEHDVCYKPISSPVN